MEIRGAAHAGQVTLTSVTCCSKRIDTEFPGVARRYILLNVNHLSALKSASPSKCAEDDGTNA
jgi:hypothetical protein